jgi:hypothetical protein
MGVCANEVQVQAHGDQILNFFQLKKNGIVNCGTTAAPGEFYILMISHIDDLLQNIFS